MTTCQECCELYYSCPFFEVREDNSKSISGNASEGLANKYEKIWVLRNSGLDNISFLLVPELVSWQAFFQNIF